MKGTKSKVKIGNKLTKKTKATLDRDNKICNKSTIQKIMKATDHEGFYVDQCNNWYNIGL